MEAKTLDTGNVKNSNGGAEMTREDDLFSDTDDDEAFPEIECEMCNKRFSSVQMYEQHLNSKKHHQMRTKLKIMKKTGISAAPKLTELDEDDDATTEELHCDVCSKTCSGYVSYLAHMRGSIHAKHMRKQKMKETLKNMSGFLEDNSFVHDEEDDVLQKPFARCVHCQKVFQGPESYQQHMKGSAHKKKVQLLKVIKDLKNEHEDPENDIDKYGQFFTKCETCNKSFNAPVPFKTHLESKSHWKELQKAQAEEQLKDLFIKDSSGTKMVCKQCDKAFPDVMSLKSHLENNSHGKQKVKGDLFSFVSSNPDIVAVKSVQSVSSEDEDHEKPYQIGDYFLVCKLCHSTFSGLESAKDHVESKKHIKAKKEKAGMKLLKEKLKEQQIEANENGSVDTKKNSTANCGPTDIATKDLPMKDSLKKDEEHDFELI